MFDYKQQVKSLNVEEHTYDEYKKAAYLSTYIYIGDLYDNLFPVNKVVKLKE